MKMANGKFQRFIPLLVR